jgi:hypothetical protein
MAARIDPTSFYSRDDLAGMLKPLGIDPDSFISKVKPVKRFRLAWWGADLIEAIEKTPSIGRDNTPKPPKRKKPFGEDGPITREEIGLTAKTVMGNTLSAKRREDDPTDTSGGTVRNHPNPGPLGRR